MTTLLKPQEVTEIGNSITSIILMRKSLLVLTGYLTPILSKRAGLGTMLIMIVFLFPLFTEFIQIIKRIEEKSTSIQAS